MKRPIFPAALVLLFGAFAPAFAADPPAVLALRAFLGPQANLTFASAREEGPVTRVERAVLHGSQGDLTIATLALEAVTAERIGHLVAEEVVGPGGGAARLELRGLTRGPLPVRAQNVVLEEANVTRFAVGGFGVLSLQLKDVRPGALASLAVGGLAAQMDGGAAGPLQLGIARLQASASDLPALLEALLVWGGVLPPGVPGPPTSGSQQIGIEGLELRASGQRAFGIGRVLAENVTAPGRENRSRLSITGLDLPAGNPATEVLAQLGYGDITGDLAGDFRHDEASGRFEVTTFGLALREVGALGLSLALDGVRQDNARPTMNDARLVAARLRYADNSLYTRFVESQARAQGLPPEALRRQYVQSLGILASGPALAPAREAATRFLLGQAREIELVLAPPRPVGQELLATLPEDAAAWQRLLGLSITAR